jgi:hypothetical protein
MPCPVPLTHVDSLSNERSVSVGPSCSPESYPHGDSPVTPTHELGRSGLALSFHIDPASLDSIRGGLLEVQEEKTSRGEGDDVVTGSAWNAEHLRCFWRLFSHLKQSLSQSGSNQGRVCGAEAKEKKAEQPKRSQARRHVRVTAPAPTMESADVKATTSTPPQRREQQSQIADVSGQLPDRWFRLCM